jgi:hypothetical protein
MLKIGVNIVEIRWPTPEWNLDAWVADVAERCEMERYEGVEPIYGYLYRLYASAAPGLVTHEKVTD